MDRNEAIKTIRTELKKKTGKSWSVTGGRGTGWGWIEVTAPPRRRVFHRSNPAVDQNQLTPLAPYQDRVIELTPENGEKAYDISFEEWDILADAFDLVNKSFSGGGVLISPDGWETYIARLVNGNLQPEDQAWPDTITINFLGKDEGYHLVGIGAYPWDCDDKENHPDSAIYISDSGSGLIASHRLTKTSEGCYKYNWS